MQDTGFAASSAMSTDFDVHLQHLMWPDVIMPDRCHASQMAWKGPDNHVQLRYSFTAKVHESCMCRLHDIHMRICMHVLLRLS